MTDLRQNLPAIIATSAFWILLFVAYALFGQRQPQAQPIKIIPPETATPEVARSQPTPAKTATPSPLRVYVSGAVISAGVYRLPPDSLTVDAIEQAGGASDDADLVAINLAHPLSDGEQIYVPTQQEAAPPPPPISRSNVVIAGSSSDASSSASMVDVNAATQEALESLPGIGPAMAKRIIAGRPYSSVDDMLRVKGVGDATLAKLRAYITVK